MRIVAVENHPLAGKCIELRRQRIALNRVIEPNICKTEVIGEDEENVRQPCNGSIQLLRRLQCSRHVARRMAAHALPGSPRYSLQKKKCCNEVLLAREECESAAVAAVAVVSPSRVQAA